MAGFITTPPLSNLLLIHWTQVKTGCDQVALCSCLFLYYHSCFAECPEDKQLPVRPATGNPSSICYHPQFSPTGPGVLKHAHLLQPCWWVWRLKHSPLGRNCLHCALLVPDLFSVILILELKSERALTVHGCICFYRLLPEQRGDLLPAGLRLSRALARLHVGMATASAGPGSS